MFEGYRIANTLALDSHARFGCEAQTLEDVMAAVSFAGQRDLPIYFTGEGSNLLPSKNVDACVVRMGLPGWEKTAESEQRVRLRICAGENWHQLVTLALSRNWYGLENLALIPGSVGAAPIQNIGAYGVELSDFVRSVRVLMPNLEVRDFDASSCEFGYRTSVFKKLTNHAILSVELELSKEARPVAHYPDVERWHERNHVDTPSPQTVFQAVTEIRRDKLPDPAEYPNAGSFFQNPVVSSGLAADLSRAFPELNVFVLQEETAKLSAAQLIDMAGCKSWQDGPVQCWQDQPLVLVNRGNASHEQLMEFAAAVHRAVDEQFGVSLTLEPVRIPG